MDWISDWISASVFSAGAGVEAEGGAAFSLSVDLEDLEDFLEDGRENIWTF